MAMATQSPTAADHARSPGEMGYRGSTNRHGGWQVRAQERECQQGDDADSVEDPLYRNG